MTSRKFSVPSPAVSADSSSVLDGGLGSYVNMVFDLLLDILFRAGVMIGLLPAFLYPTILVSLIGVTCGEL